MVEPVSRPQRLWPGLVLLLSPAALIGGLSASAEAQSCITSRTTSDAVTNNGCITTIGSAIESNGNNATITNTNSGTITTSGFLAWGIVSFGDDAAVTNSGTITTSGTGANGITSAGANATITNSGTITTSGNDAHGIYVVGSGATISNLGTITTTGANAFGIFRGGGSVVTLTNAQGGNTPLTYRGALPATYNVFVRSLTSFGRLAVTNPSGTMTFGIDVGSTLAANRYADVLTGVAASAITNAETEFTLGRFAWTLTAGSAANSWDLLARLLGPDAAATQLGLQSNAYAVRSVLGQRAAATTFALEYDCSVFDEHGFCVSVGARNTQMGNNYSDTGETAGLIAAAYRVTQELRIGGFIDQNLVTQSPVGVDPKNTQPMLGAFAVYQENADFSGLTIRAALAYQQGDLRITRPELTDTEAGTGRAQTSALAFGGEIAYGVPLDNTWVAQPYAGLRRSDSQRRGYTETTSDSVEYPITYNRFGQQVTSATAGLRLRGAITPEFSLTFGAGMEHDLNSKMDRYSGTSTIAGLETFSINASQQQNETRAVGSAGMRYMVASNQAVAFDASVRQMPYGNDPSITTMLRYSIGF